ncbi:PIG-L deacetylase family protein [Couchioplanes azureus]|uniref:PIG-L deacetylase family protein n=1 Tax=Couchioplanes caeruleus TaxID=56438 RepID=UPI001670D303|nr:PIG-L family deacetylase [Couchioplanes caeruleus]
MASPQELVLMAVHAHPGPESTNTGGILAHYARQGVRVVLVTCTDGQLGTGAEGAAPGQDGHDPSAVAETRRAELRAAGEHLGVHHLELLGYRDSGMDAAGPPGGFRDVPVEEVAARIGALVERYRPQVVVTYDPEVHYHPDHTHAALATQQAVRETGIPAKGYSVALGAAYWTEIHDAAVRAGLREDGGRPGPGAEARQVDDRITTIVDVAEVLARKQAAILAHASQIRGTWIERLFSREMPAVLGRETYIRTWDRSGAPLPERDLFAGIRADRA